MQHSCPTPDSLARFADAALSDGEANEILAHLASCNSCSQKVDELEQQPDQPILLSLRELQDKMDPPPNRDTPLPRTIGQYEILQKIGQGGMGIVYRAVHPHLKREVALKVIRDTRLSDPGVRERFVQEMQSLGQLAHPNIVHATDAGTIDNTPFLVTEMLVGQDLGSWITEHGPMPAKQAIDCVRQAAIGLAYAHKAGYVHRDIKPANLFLTRDGVVKILDLGIARPIGVNAGQTMTGHVVGSPDFMAPEQFRGGSVDARSDIYSLGQTFVLLLTGNRRATENTPIPPKLKTILAKMTAGLPEQRFQTAEDVCKALNNVQLDCSLPSFRFILSTVLCVVLCLVGVAITGLRKVFREPNQAPVPIKSEATTDPKNTIEPENATEPKHTIEPETTAPQFGVVDIWNNYFIDEGSPDISDILLTRLNLNFEPVDASLACQALVKLHDYDIRNQGKANEAERGQLVRDVIRECSKAGLGSIPEYPLDLSNPADGLLAKAVEHFQQSEQDRQDYLLAKSNLDAEITDADIRHYVRLGNERYQQVINAKSTQLDQPTPWEFLQSATKGIIDILESNEYGTGAAAAKRKALEAAGGGAAGALVVLKSVQSKLNLFSDLDPENPVIQAFVKRIIYSDRLMKRDQKRWSIENELHEAGFGTHPPESM